MLKGAFASGSERTRTDFALCKPNGPEGEDQDAA